MQLKSLKSGIAMAVVGIAALGVGFFIGQKKTASKNSDETEVTYAIVQGEKIKGKDVFDKIKNELEALEESKYRVKRRAVEEWIRIHYSSSTGANNGASNNRASNEDWKKLEITPSELEAFLKIRNLDAKKLPSKELENILNNMKFQKMKEGKKKVEDMAMADLKIQWKIPLPPMRVIEMEKSSVEPLGERLAPIDITLVGNFFCPTCLEADKKLNELKSKYKDKLQITYRFSFNEKSESMLHLTAEAAMCASLQNQFWAFYSQAIHSPPISMKAVSAIADKMTLNHKDFDECLSSHKTKMAVEKDLQYTKKMKLEEVPIFVINGLVINAQGPIDVFTRAIDSLL